MSARRRGVAVAAFATVAVLAGACGFRQALPNDDLHDWSAVPLAADERLTTAAIKATVCRMGDDTAPAPEILLQDRRTALSAAFLVSGPGWSGSCLITIAAGNASGGGGARGGPSPALATALAVDERSSGGVGSGTAGLLGGRAAADVATVQIVLADGRSVTASLASGHWLAWWPGSVDAAQVKALDANGVALQTLTDTTPVYEQK